MEANCVVGVVARELDGDHAHHICESLAVLLEVGGAKLNLVSRGDGLVQLLGSLVLLIHRVALIAQAAGRLQKAWVPAHDFIGGVARQTSKCVVGVDDGTSGNIEVADCEGDRTVNRAQFELGVGPGKDSELGGC